MRTFLLLTFLFVAPAANGDEILARLEALNLASRAGDHERAVELAIEVTRTNPNRADAWYLLGRHAEALGRHQLAIDASMRAWKIGYRSMPWIALRIARSAAALDNRDLAFAWIEHALDAGFENRQEIATIPEFEKYLEHARFRRLAAIRPPDLDRSSGIRSDIDLLVEEAQRNHAHPDRPAHGRAFLRAADDLKRRASDLTDADLLDGLRRLTALLDDGHTVTYGITEGSPLRDDPSRLPVKVYLFEEGLYIIESYTPATDWLVGRRVSAIGASTPDELLRASRRIHGSDNAMTMMWLGPQFYFTSVSFLRSAGAIDGDLSAVDVTLASPEGEEETVRLQPGEFPIVRKLHALRSMEESPLYLRNVDTNYWMQRLEKDGAVYVQFNQVRDDEAEPIPAFAERLGATLSTGKISDLIIDVRHNNGGNNGLLDPLIRQIVAFDVRPDTDVWVITGRNTFSAAQNFINRIERITDTIFVGEPSSSSPNFTGEETELVLPWSRVAVSISSRYWQDADPGDERTWIAPHIPVEPTAADYFAGRDAALEAILDRLD